MSDQPHRGNYHVLKQAAHKIITCSYKIIIELAYWSKWKTWRIFPLLKAPLGVLPYISSSINMSTAFHSNTLCLPSWLFKNTLLEKKSAFFFFSSFSHFTQWAISYRKHHCLSISLLTEIAVPLIWSELTGSGQFLGKLLSVSHILKSYFE